MRERITIEEAVELSGLKKSSLYQMKCHGVIEFIKIPNRKKAYIDKECFQNYLDFGYFVTNEEIIEMTTGDIK